MTPGERSVFIGIVIFVIAVSLGFTSLGLGGDKGTNWAVFFLTISHGAIGLMVYTFMSQKTKENL